MSNRSSKNEVSWSRAGEGVTVLVWGRTEGGPGGKFGEGKLVLDSLEVLRSEWANLAVAIEDVVILQDVDHRDLLCLKVRGPSRCVRRRKNEKPAPSGTAEPGATGKRRPTPNARIETSR